MTIVSALKPIVPVGNVVAGPAGPQVTMTPEMQRWMRDVERATADFEKRIAALEVAVAALTP